MAASNSRFSHAMFGVLECAKLRVGCNSQAPPCFSLFSTPKSAVSPRRVVRLANKEESKLERTGIDSGVDWKTSCLRRQVKRGCLGVTSGTSFDLKPLISLISRMQRRFPVYKNQGLSICLAIPNQRLFKVSTIPAAFRVRSFGRL